jgi:hypothetical protein
MTVEPGAGSAFSARHGRLPDESLGVFGSGRLRAQIKYRMGRRHRRDRPVKFISRRASRWKLSLFANCEASMVKFLEALIDLFCRAVGIPELFGDEFQKKRRLPEKAPDFGFLDDKKP